MFVRSFVENIQNPPARSRWKTKLVGLFQCDQCLKTFTTYKNVKRKRNQKLHFCNRSCSSKARIKGGKIYQKSAKKMMQIYGVNHVFSHPTIIKKRKQTMKKRYGVINASTLDWVKEKKKQTCLKTYGVEVPLQSEEVQEKKRQTCMKKYGFEHATQSPKIKKKSEETCLRRYGVRNFSLSDEFTQRFNKGDYHNHKTKNGHFTLLKKQYYYRSSYELEVLLQLKQIENNIQTFTTNYVIPYLFKGKKYKYLADFFIITTTQKTFIIETKNNYLLSQKKTQAKIAAANVFCDKRGWCFLLLTNDEIEKVNLAKLLLSNPIP